MGKSIDELKLDELRRNYESAKAAYADVALGYDRAKEEMTVEHDKLMASDVSASLRAAREKWAVVYDKKELALRALENAHAALRLAALEAAGVPSVIDE